MKLIFYFFLLFSAISSFANEEQRLIPISATKYDGVILGRSDKYDGYPAHLKVGGYHYIWWCGFKSIDGRGLDAIYFAKKSGGLGTSGWTSPVSVLDHRKVPWADSHICDPSVIRGSFLFSGRTYSYALYFTADVAQGAANRIGVAFSNDGINWIVNPTPVIESNSDPGSNYGAGMSGVSFDPTTGEIIHAFLDTTLSPILRLMFSKNGTSFYPRPAVATRLHEAGRNGSGQGPDIAFNPLDGYWYATVKGLDPNGIYDGEVRVVRSTNPRDLYGSWDLVAVFNKSNTSWSQNHNPGLGKTNGGRNLYVDSNGWGYVFFTVGLERPNVKTWQVAQARFKIPTP